MTWSWTKEANRTSSMCRVSVCIVVELSNCQRTRSFSIEANLCLSLPLSPALAESPLFSSGGAKLKIVFEEEYKAPD